MDQAPKDKSLTIYDLAELAGVSYGTVSRVLNNRAPVNEQTRQRVLTLARQHGMRPRATARKHQVALVTRPPSRTVMGGYVSCVTQHLAYALASEGISLLMVSEDRVNHLESHLIDGVIAAAWQPDAIRVLANLPNTPIVFINRLDLAERFSIAGTDHVEAGRLAAEHLLARGHRRLALINDKAATWATKARSEGYVQAMRRHGIEPEPTLLTDHASGTHFQTAVNSVVAAGADSLWVPGEDLGALQALKVLQQDLGARVPEDISVIGNENPGLSGNTCPPLTTIEQPLAKLAERAVRLLLDLAQGAREGPAQEILPIRLIDRDSVMTRDATAPT